MPPYNGREHRGVWVKLVQHPNVSESRVIQLPSGRANVEEGVKPALKAPGNHLRGVPLLKTFCLHSAV